MKQDLLWETWCNHAYGRIDPVITRSERGRLNKALKELREINATPEEMREKIALYPKLMPAGCTLTITALVANWGRLVKPKVAVPRVGSYKGPPPVSDEARQIGLQTLAQLRHGRVR